MNELKYDKNKLHGLCRKYRLSLVVLHGSFAKGFATSKSDIDVGILGEPRVIKNNYFNILSDFSEVFGDRFDPVFLNGAEAMITRNVALRGIPLYEKKKGLFNSFKVGALARYLDTKKFRLLEQAYINSAIQKAQ